MTNTQNNGRVTKIEVPFAFRVFRALAQGDLACGECGKLFAAAGELIRADELALALMVHSHRGGGE